MVTTFDRVLFEGVTEVKVAFEDEANSCGDFLAVSAAENDSSGEAVGISLDSKVIGASSWTASSTTTASALVNEASDVPASFEKFVNDSEAAATGNFGGASGAVGSTGIAVCEWLATVLVDTLGVVVAWRVVATCGDFMLLRPIANASTTATINKINPFETPCFPVAVTGSVDALGAEEGGSEVAAVGTAAPRLTPLAFEVGLDSPVGPDREFRGSL